MTELDISKTFCPVLTIHKAAYSKIKRFLKPLVTKSRHSDAFVLVLHGSCHYTFENHSFTANAGDIIYLAKGEAYEMNVTDDSYDVIFCDFCFDGTQKRKSIVATLASPIFGEKEFSKLYRILKEDNKVPAMAQIYKIYSLFIPEQATQKTVPKEVLKLKARIEESFTNPDFGLFGNEQYAISEVYLRRLFVKNYGLQPVKYLTALRINRAKELLSFSTLSVEECANESGFASSQYFCRVFKNMVGITPAEYRKQNHSSI